MKITGTGFSFQVELDNTDFPEGERTGERLALIKDRVELFVIAQIPLVKQELPFAGRYRPPKLGGFMSFCSPAIFQEEGESDSEWADQLREHSKECEVCKMCLSLKYNQNGLRPQEALERNK